LTDESSEVPCLLFDQDAMPRARPEHKELLDHLYTAWAIIANAQYWDITDRNRYGEWVAARSRWRDRFHELLDKYLVHDD